MKVLDAARQYVHVLPEVRRWLDAELSRWESSAVPLADDRFSIRMPQYFPLGVIDIARVARVPSVPRPPLARFGFGILGAQLGQMRWDGLTLKSTILLGPHGYSEAMIFHELVHVVQWSTLGVERFLATYGVGLLRNGYRSSPLERTAYSLQAEFANAYERLPVGEALVARISEEARAAALDADRYLDG